MAADASGRIRYLALAAFAQKIIDALVRFLDEDDDSLLDSALSEAGRLLTAIIEGKFFELRGLASIGSYEQLQALRSAWPSAQEVSTRLARVMDAEAGAEERRRAAEELLESFLALERRALWDAAQPEPLGRLGTHSRWPALQTL